MSRPSVGDALTTNPSIRSGGVGGGGYTAATSPSAGQGYPRQTLIGGGRPPRSGSSNFLSPEGLHVAFKAGTIERAPSLNRLGAQSSTETSGLGETVTSGFSSQESINSNTEEPEPSSRRGEGGEWSRHVDDKGHTHISPRGDNRIYPTSLNVNQRNYQHKPEHSNPTTLLQKSSHPRSIPTPSYSSSQNQRALSSTDSQTGLIRNRNKTKTVLPSIEHSEDPAFDQQEVVTETSFRTRPVVKLTDSRVPVSQRDRSPTKKSRIPHPVNPHRPTEHSSYSIRDNIPGPQHPEDVPTTQTQQYSRSTDNRPVSSSNLHFQSRRDTHQPDINTSNQQETQNFDTRNRSQPRDTNQQSTRQRSGVAYPTRTQNTPTQGHQVSANPTSRIPNPTSARQQQSRRDPDSGYSNVPEPVSGRRGSNNAPISPSENVERILPVFKQSYSQRNQRNASVGRDYTRQPEPKHQTSNLRENVPVHDRTQSSRSSRLPVSGGTQPSVAQRERTSSRSPENKHFNQRSGFDRTTRIPTSSNPRYDPKEEPRSPSADGSSRTTPTPSKSIRSPSRSSIHGSKSIIYQGTNKSPDVVRRRRAVSSSEKPTESIELSDLSRTKSSDISEDNSRYLDNKSRLSNVTNPESDRKFVVVGRVKSLETSLDGNDHDRENVDYSKRNKRNPVREADNLTKTRSLEEKRFISERRERGSVKGQQTHIRPESKQHSESPLSVNRPPNGVEREEISRTVNRRPHYQANQDNRAPDVPATATTFVTQTDAGNAVFQFNVERENVRVQRKYSDKENTHSGVKSVRDFFPGYRGDSAENEIHRRRGNSDQDYSAKRADVYSDYKQDVSVDLHVNEQRRRKENLNEVHQKPPNDPMDYEECLHRSNPHVKGARRARDTGGGEDKPGHRGYPAALDGGYASPPIRPRQGGGIYSIANGEVPKASPRSSSTRKHSEGTMVAPKEALTSSNKSPPYTKFRSSVPQVQVISGVDTPGLNIEHIDREWERRDSKSSAKSKKSSSRGSNQFLGRHTQSAWTKWSKDRRASYRRRIEQMEAAEQGGNVNNVSLNNNNEIGRVSTPIKKARQEGLIFVHPDHRDRILTETDLQDLQRHKQRQVHAMKVIEKTGKKKNFRLKSEEVKLSAEQWHVLSEFWEHPFFVKARYLGGVASLLGLIFMAVSIASPEWVKHSEYLT